ncbi:hypothetical protein [Phenylobacterium sp. SCN 70-31]|uniref:hypothetical protein n=1 Tax=Phenylobacterium sp. SCN 70-31 TaxID=1660129 RepID=UPI00086AB794|nr:hypothetical protein [Phenylobacterium sp. SCN 70-31]ODT89872.1 MAG: hypothetical protein ABS78_00615 [Phenylobacterium sp. SCN 70-31]
MKESGAPPPEGRLRRGGGALMAGVSASGVILLADLVASRFYRLDQGDHWLLTVSAMTGAFVFALLARRRKRD